MTNLNKKLYRSNENKVVFGIIGGIGEYFNVDPVILRVVYIILSAFAWFVPGIVAYFIMALVVPSQPLVVHEEAK